MFKHIKTHNNLGRQDKNDNIEHRIINFQTFSLK